MKIIEDIKVIIAEENKLHYNYLIKFLNSCDKEYLEFANEYLLNYISITGIGIKELVNSYNIMIKDSSKEQVYFKKNNKYRLSSQEEANELYYGNKEYMYHYMHGLAISQFLWPQHKNIFFFFKSIIKSQKGKKYLEVGPGHGLFFLESILDGKFDSYLAVDISETSLDITKKMIKSFNVKNNDIEYINKDIFDFNSHEKYSFIVMCEVLEHLEKPEEILKKLFDLLEENGRAFFTTCANCPMVDHIYLYRSVEEIERMIESIGFKIIDSNIAPSSNLTIQEAIDHKVSIMYGALVEKI